MAAHGGTDPERTRAAVAAIADWLGDGDLPAPARAAVGEAVRLTARTLAATAPGTSVEVRVPPFVAVQCISGARHTRGNPPNVVEVDARSWLLLVTGRLRIADAVASGALLMSGARAPEVANWLPLAGLAE